MARDPSNPHDMFFRNMLGRPEDAASEVRLMVPEELVPRVDWESLEQLPGTFVSDEMKDRQSDLLFRARLDGREAFVYLLLEHQSGNDAVMAFRMLAYVVSIWTNYLREHKGAKVLPPIIPLVVHVGPQGDSWTAPREVAELIDIEPDLRAVVSEYLPRMRYLLDDVNAVDVRALLARPLSPGARVLLVLEKVAGDPDLLEAHLPDLNPDLLEILAGQGGKQHFGPVALYLMTVGEIRPDDLNSLFDPLGPEAKEVIVTTAEMLKARGRAEGRTEGRAETLVELLTEKFGPLRASVEQSIRESGPDRLKVLSARLLKAASVDEVLA